MKKFYFLFIFVFLNYLTYSQTIVFEEKFEDSTFRVTSFGSSLWNVYDSLQSEGSFCYYNKLDTNDVSYLETESFSTIGNYHVILQFDQICKIELFDTASIEISVDNGNTWIILDTNYYYGSANLLNGYGYNSLSYNPDWQPFITNYEPNNGWWKAEKFLISSIAANKPNVKIRFKIKDGNNNGVGEAAGWFIDNIRVMASLEELDPPIITLLDPIYEDTIINNPGPYNIKAQITDESGIFYAILYWNRNNGPIDSILMINTSDDIYEAAIPVQAYNSSIFYTIKAIDSSLSHNVGELSNNFYTRRLILSDVIIGEGSNNYYSVLPFYGYYEYSYGGMIYSKNEIQTNGFLKKIAFNVGNNINNYSINNQYIYIGETTDSIFNSTNLIDTATLTRVKGPFSLSINNSGWYDFEFSNDFNYSGNNNLLIIWINNSHYSTLYFPKFCYNIKNNAGIYKGQNATPIPMSTTGYRTTYRPNIKLGFEVSTQDNDMQFIAITEPTTTVYTTNVYDIKAKVKNYGNDTVFNFTIKYTINGVLQPEFHWNGTILTDEIKEIVFANNVSFQAGNVNIKAWITNPNGIADQNPQNDTTTVSFNCCSSGYSGIYTINSSLPTSGTNFHSINDAIFNLSECGLTGPVTLELVDSIYNGSYVIPSFPHLSSTNTLTIKPQSGKNVTIASNNSSYVIKILASKYIIIDGSNNGTNSRNLTIKQLATSGAQTSIQIASDDNSQGSHDIVIKNINVACGHNKINTSAIFIGGSTFPNSTAKNSSNIIIDNVNIEKSYYGIYSNGDINSPINNVSVLNSTLGSDNQANYIKNTGIYFVNTKNSLINKNLIFNIQDDTLINQPFYAPRGIYLFNGCSNVQITNNIIKSVKYLNTSGYGGHGINLSTNESSSNILIANNMISDMYGDGFNSIINSSMAGIVISSSTGNVKIYNNSIHLFGSYNKNFATITTAFFVDNGCNNLDVRNNIFANGMINIGNINAKSYAIFSLTPSSYFTYLDYNDYYVYNNQGILGYINSTNILDLENLRNITNTNMHSVSVNPLFFADNDLHTYQFELFKKGANINIISTDIDGEPRDPLFPSIGADEVNILPNNLKLLSIDDLSHSCGYGSSEVVKFSVINAGSNPVTSFDAYYIYDNQPVVFQTFNANLNFLDTLQFTFTNTIDLSEYGNHSIKVYVNMNNDMDHSNDTLYKEISNGHNFSNGPYTMGFEPNEPYKLFTNIDTSNNMGLIFPYFSAYDAHSGSYSVKYNNNSLSSAGNWLFTRCFNLQGGETYKVSYWYKASAWGTNHTIYLAYSDAIDLDNLNFFDTLSNIYNTSYIEQTATFTPDSSGVYYIGFGFFSPYSSNFVNIDDIEISWLPSIDVEMLEVVYPVTDCNINQSNVVVKAKNNGTLPISNIPLKYQVNGSSNIIGEIYNSTVLPGDTFTFTFSHLEDFSAYNQNITYSMRCWADMPNDLYNINDTIDHHFISRRTPHVPNVSNETILVNQSANLNAIVDTGVVALWYADSLLNNLLYQGNNYSTPPLIDTTIYYVIAKVYSEPTIIGNMSSSQGTYYAPIATHNTYSFSSMIYLSNEINKSGWIDTIAFYVTNVDNIAHVYPNQKIYFYETTNSEHTSANLPDTTNMVQVLNGTVNIDHFGWNKIALDEPFYYSGNKNLQIVWINNSEHIYQNNRYFLRTDLTNYRTLYGNNNTPFFTAGTLAQYIPNIRLSWEGCQSDIVKDTVFVLNSSDYELSVVDLLFPIDNICTEVNTYLTVKLGNAGNNPIPAGVSVSCILNNLMTVSTLTSAPIPANGTLDVTFTQPLIIPFDNNGKANVSLKIFHNSPQYSLSVGNDTIYRDLTLYFQPDQPIVNSSVTLAGLPAYLTAISQADSITFWSTDSLGHNIVNVGHDFLTPTLYDTSIYYVYTKVEEDPIIIGNMANNQYTMQYPVYTTSNYSCSSMLYYKNEINRGGYIDTIAFYAYSDNANCILNNQKIYFDETNMTIHTSSNLPDTIDMQLVYMGQVKFDKQGWCKIGLQHPFYYTGNENLHIIWLNLNGAPITGGQTFLRTDMGSNRGLWIASSNSFSTTDGYRTSYIPNILVKFHSCTSNILPDTAYVLPSTPYELSIEELVNPINDNCTDPLINVTVKVRNYGTNTIPAGINLYCVLNNDTIIGTIPDDILPLQDYIFTFNNSYNVNFVNNISDIDVKIYHNGFPQYSIVIYNDTLQKHIRLFKRVQDPIVYNSVIDFGQVDTLVAYSIDNLPIHWYADNIANNLLHIGDTLITPYLLDTIIYYVSANTFLYNGYNNRIVGDMLTSNTTYYMPINATKKFSYSSMIYLSNEIGQAGIIDTISFYVNNDPYNFYVDHQRIFIKEIDNNAHTSNTFPDTTTMLKVYDGSIVFNGHGWQKIPLQNVFNFSGNKNLQIVWINSKSNIANSGYVYFKRTNFSSNRGLSFSADNVDYTSSASYANYLPNIYFSLKGCSSQLVPDTVFVINNPPYELAVEQLLAPLDSSCSSSQAYVSVRLHNYGNSTIPSGASITCKLNNSITITSNTTEPIQPDGSIDFVFSSPLNIPFIHGIANINLQVYPTNQDYSTLTFNDTLNKNLYLKLLPTDPLAVNDTVNLFEAAELTAIHQSQTNLFWFNDINTNDILHVGEVLYTPPLVNDTTFFAMVNAASSPYYIGDVNSTNSTNYLPFNGYYSYSFGSIIYLANEINRIGYIDTIAFYVSNSMSNYTINNQKVYFKLINNNEHNDNSLPDTSQMNLIFQGNISINGSGWVKIPLSKPFYYDGTKNLQILWLNLNGNWGGNYPNFKTMNVSDYRGLYNYSYYSLPQYGGTYSNNIPILRINISECNSNKVPVTAHVVYPSYEVALEDLISPAWAECNDGSTNIVVRLKNYGNLDIPAGLELKCIVNGSLIINENTNVPIPAHSFIDYALTNSISLQFINGQDSVHIKLYNNSPAYTINPQNDTIEKFLYFRQKPLPPISNSVIINYASNATLSGTPSDPSNIINWYSDPLGNNIIGIGNYLTTPNLFDTTIYYLATQVHNNINIYNNNLDTISTMPANGYYQYSFASMIYLNSEIGSGGYIDTLYVNVVNTTLNYTFHNQKIYLGDILTENHNSNILPSTSNMQLVYQGDITLNNGWVKIPLQHNYYYSGENNLQILWLNYDGEWEEENPEFLAYNAGNHRGLFSYNDFTFPSTGTYSNTIPAIKISLLGCRSDIVADTVFVTNIPAIDVGISEIIEPNSGIELTDHEQIKVAIKNYSNNDLVNVSFPIAFQINHHYPIIEQFVGNIPAMGIATYTFSNNADLSVVGTYIITAYTNYFLDTIRNNDTLEKIVVNNPLTYCISSANYTVDEDICRVKINDFENVSGYTNAQYSDFTNLDGLFLYAGEQSNITIDVCDDPSSYNAGYVRVFIDYNHNGVYDLPDESAFLQSYLPDSHNTINGVLNVPLGVHYGFTNMRIIASSGQNPPNPCGIYPYGETEDYKVLLIPHSNYDAGIKAAKMEYMQFENSTASAQVTVKNFGLQPLNTFNIVTLQNNQFVSSTPWNGNIPANDTLNIMINNIPTNPYINDICFIINAPSDTIPFNNKKCVSYNGLPSLIVFEDDFDDNTQLISDNTGLWEHGVPQGTIINYPHSMPNVWMTKITTNYPDGVEGYLEFPTLNFSGIVDPYISFYYWKQSEYGHDGAYLQYSLNDGNSWITLGGLNDLNGYNWYNDYLDNGRPSFTGFSNQWVPAFYKLTMLSNKNNVKLRIGFLSNDSTNFDGFAIDDIKISVYQVSNNVALTEIITPTSPTTTGTTQIVKVKIANVGANTVYNVPISYKINNGQPVNEIFADSLSVGDTVIYTFTTPFIAPHLDYTLCAYTRYNNDIITVNDTMCVNIHSLPAAYDVGVVEILNPLDSTPINIPITVSVIVKNFGANAVSNIPVRYQINYTNDHNDIINTTLNPGDTIHFTFSNTYLCPNNDYIICAGTVLNNDMYTINDDYCEMLTTYTPYNITIYDMDDRVIIYPNPSTGEFNIQLKSSIATDGMILVRNPLGELLFSENINVKFGFNMYRFDISHLSAGLYNCTIIVGNKTYNNVVIIQK